MIGFENMSSLVASLSPPPPSKKHLSWKCCQNHWSKSIMTKFVGTNRLSGLAQAVDRRIGWMVENINFYKRKSLCMPTKSVANLPYRKIIFYYWYKMLHLTGRWMDDETDRNAHTGDLQTDRMTVRPAERCKQETQLGTMKGKQRER